MFGIVLHVVAKMASFIDNSIITREKVIEEKKLFSKTKKQILMKY